MARKNRRFREKRKYLFLTASSIFLVAGLSMLLYVSKLEPKIEKQLETIIVLQEQGEYSDLTQTNEGTIAITFRARDEDVNIGENQPTKVQLFRSRVLQGLGVYYLYAEKMIEAGMPKIKTTPVNVLDGEMHKIIYTFKKGSKQAIYFDGNKLAEGDYKPETTIIITGLVVKQEEIKISTDKGDIEFDVYNEVLTEEEIKKIGKP